MAQGKSPRNPMAFASVSYPGRCLASQPIHLDGSKTTIAQNAKGPYCRRLLYIFLLLLILRLRCPVSGVYPATWTAHVTPVLIHLFHCTAIIFAAVAAATDTVAASAIAATPSVKPRGGGFVVDLPYQMHH